MATVLVHKFHFYPVYTVVGPTTPNVVKWSKTQNDVYIDSKTISTL